MAIVNSVLGPLDTKNLGLTLMHEHLLSASFGIPQCYPELLGSRWMERLVDALKESKEGGVDTIVDATTVDLGRDVSIMAEASRQSGVNIIACTGMWLDIPRHYAVASTDQLAEVFAREIQEGIVGTNIKAGILKAASDIQGVTPATENILRAVARAHQKTGAPIMLHSYSPGRVGIRQLAILKEEGVDLKRVKLDHSNDTADVEYLTLLVDQGCYLGMDRYPGRNLSSSARTKILKELISAGYAGRICLSHDWSMITVESAWLKLFGETPEDRQKRNPYGFLYFKKVIFPQLREMGVSDAVLDNLCIDGPRNFLEGV